MRKRDQIRAKIGSTKGLILKYLRGIIDWCLHFNKFLVVLEEFCDANWVSDNDEVSSTSAYVFNLGGGLFRRSV